MIDLRDIVGKIGTLLPISLTNYFSREQSDTVTVDSKIGSREIPLAVQRSHERGVIIISYPGVDGSINGYNQKYLKLAAHLAETANIGTVVRLGNHYEPRIDYSHSVIDDLAAVIERCKVNAKRWCGASTPDIFLMGFSAGASAVAAVAGEFPEIKKILLVAPSADADEQRIRSSLAKFQGDLCAAVGSHDIVVGTDAAEQFAALAPNAASKRTFVIPECDHQFRGEINGKILSALPLVAFTNRLSVPDPVAGIKLY